MRVTEDDLYRSTTQFKHWSFTAQQLAEQRLKTNIQASERVKANVARQRAQRAQQSDNDGTNSGIENGSGANTPNPVISGREVDCLTADEEMKIVDDFCERAIKLGTHCGFPFDAIATCIQYLRRFYLYNSPMTYHVQNILRTSMFLATKAECMHENVDKFAANSGRNVTSESILAAEYLVMQALRYNLDVRHPFRGLKGAHLELIELAHGKYTSSPLASATDLQTRMLQLPLTPTGAASTVTAKAMEDRINAAYGTTSNILKTAALFTDAYFLYTPSQIWFAAHLLADEQLTLFYLSVKLPTTSPIHAKLLQTLRNCATLLSAHRTYRTNTLPPAEKDRVESAHQEEIRGLIAKLKGCRDPDKVDLVKLNQAQKRDAVQGEALEESKAKRRKLAREGYEKESDAFWGPELPKTANGE